uniref:Uncharacterized protein n=2 Tax=Setaria TaxID=4554 RepID=K3YXG5_SETIT|nr:hypothetical protein SEVIR_1G354750v2 [Setaria viridis]
MGLVTQVVGGVSPMYRPHGWASGRVGIRLSELSMNSHSFLCVSSSPRTSFISLLPGMTDENVFCS